MKSIWFDQRESKNISRNSCSCRMKYIVKLWTLRSWWTTFKRKKYFYLPPITRATTSFELTSLRLCHPETSILSIDPGEILAPRNVSVSTIDQTIPTLISQKHIVSYLQLIKQYWSPTAPKHINTICVRFQSRELSVKVGLFQSYPA